MFIDVIWGNDDKTLIVQTFHPGWTIVDFRESVRLVLSMIEDQNHIVDVIVDMTHPEVNISQMPVAGATARATIPENMGRMIMANNYRFVVMLSRTAQIFFPGLAQRLHFVADVDAAYEQLANKNR
ncbi:MAG: hypothetical protein AAF125_00615 [Chloroflexota bacterium]